MMYSFSKELIIRVPSFPTPCIIDAAFMEKRIANPLFRASVLLASPSLYAVLGNSRLDEKAFQVLHKYVLRSCFRSTPFGLFSGLGVGLWASNSHVLLQSQAPCPRLSFQAAAALREELLSCQHIWPYTHLYVNPSMIDTGHFLMYIEHVLSESRSFYNLLRIDKDSYIDKLLSLCQSGCSFEEILSSFLPEDFTSQQITEFIILLVDKQVLVTDFDLYISGKEILQHYLDNLNQATGIVPEIHHTLHILKSVKDIFSNITSASCLYDLKQVDSLLEQTGISTISTGGHHVNMDQKMIFSHNNISCEYQKRILRSVECLHALVVRQIPENLVEFSRAFEQKYGDRAVSLISCTDADMGIGYLKAGPDLDTVLPSGITAWKTAANAIDELTLNKATLYLLQKWQQSQFASCLTLQEKDLIAHFDKPHDSLPSSLSVMFTLLDKACGHDLYIKTASGDSALNLQARFAHGNPDIAAICQQIASTEQKANPDVIFADIDHIETLRIANVKAHPSFYDYQIVFHARCGLPSEIPVNDLYLQMQHGELLLFSKSLNKRVIPRINNAFNHSLSRLGVYHFLCDYSEYSHDTSLAFDWGGLDEVYSFLPRVILSPSSCILSAAIWRIDINKLLPLLNASTDEHLIHSALQLQQYYHLPNDLLFCQADMELYFRTDNVLTLRSMLSCVNQDKDKHVTFKELLPVMPIIKDVEHQSYQHEMIALLIRSDKSFQGASSLGFFSSGVQDKYVPGSCWLYFKIICAELFSDYLLVHLILPFLEKVTPVKHFFIRYHEHSDYQLRFRLFIEEPNDRSHVLNSFRDIVDAEFSTMISSYSLDTYIPEYQRYGQSTISFCEDIFGIDSSFVLQILHMQLSDESIPSSDIWKIGIKGIVDLMDSFGFSLRDKFAFVSEREKSFSDEYKKVPAYVSRINKGYYILRSEIADLLDDTNRINVQAADLLKGRKSAVTSVATNILSVRSHQNNTTDLNDMVSSLIHMFVNRLFARQQRLQEGVLYTYLFHYYRGVIKSEKIN